MEEGRRWEELGIDCLANAFERLNLEDLTLGVPFVCKSWYKASLSPSCWKVLNFQDLQLIPWKSPNFSARFEQQYKLKSFSFKGLFKFTVHRSRQSVFEICFPRAPFSSLGDLIHASNECPGLKILTLPTLLPQDDPHLPALVSKWKDLQVLKMGLKPSSFIAVLQQINQHCQSFISLQLFGYINRKDALAITTLVPQLKFLILSKSYLQKEELLMILNGCKELDHLNVSMCRGFNVDDEIMKKASSIKDFECEGTKFEEDYGEDYDEYDDVHWSLVFGDY